MPTLLGDRLAVQFSSANDSWETPPALYTELHDEFSFDLNPASDESNFKCEQHYTITDHCRAICLLAPAHPGYTMFQIVVPGERWEVEFAENGEVEVEIFTSNGTIRDSDALEDLFTRFSN